VIGGLIAGVFTLKGVDKAHKNDLEKQQIEEERMVDSFLQMIKTEVNAVWQRYSSTMGTNLESLPEGEFLRSTYEITQNYFAI